MSVTLDDISKATGFSIPTVSRVLSNSRYPVSAATRQRILEVAQSLGYRPNLAARGLRTDRTNTVGILVDDIMSPFVPSIVRGIQDALVEQGFSCMIMNSDWNPDLERAAIEGLLSRPVDGIIFVEYFHRAAHEALAQTQKPHLFVHRLFGGAVKNSIVPDDHHGAALAMRHLIDLGHRRIGYINGPESWHNSRDRLAGYRDELARHGLDVDPALIQPGDWEFESGYDAATNLLALADPPTAIFAANDLMALGAIYGLQDAGLAVPADVAVVGYDNRDFTQIFRPKITTVSLPVYEMGRTAAERLLTQITTERRGFEEIKIKGRLYVRESCGAATVMQTPDEPLGATKVRRILLNKQPED
ncbi:MAG TPA: LacI family DNA-binding transcriptional regulator [Roseiflexaceae bacterium]|nr:LacI family DNA-binding transcriptional regulator [Roseiflexaceae bacterium]